MNLGWRSKAAATEHTDFVLSQNKSEDKSELAHDHSVLRHKEPDTSLCHDGCLANVSHYPARKLNSNRSKKRKIILHTAACLCPLTAPSEFIISCKFHHQLKWSDDLYSRTWLLVCRHIMAVPWRYRETERAAAVTFSFTSPEDFVHIWWQPKQKERKSSFIPSYHYSWLLNHRMHPKKFKLTSQKIHFQEILCSLYGLTNTKFIQLLFRIV